MRIPILFIGLLLISLTSHAQPAPDFTVTDSHGQVHHLYADYLNQGKTVLLEVFFTTCPPCNSIAPLIEPFYQEWGGGNNDVEFFELSDKSFDTDALVNNFQTLYSETFVGVGKDGGSLTAVIPYKNGTYGPWFGTPCFVVIAPDGTVQYDVSGNSNQATIDAIDAALSATGAEKPGQSIPTAPDFNVTDIEGQSHRLYANYLNNGKTVLLEIFNTTCSPCNSISPLLQSLYQDWGVGNHDVEFIELSDKNTDTDDLVAAYRESHGETFVGISKDGGSLAAVVPYKDGTFGPPDDNPVFVVIAPDGTVNYNVHGANDAATIAALATALAATGAENPPPPSNLAPDFTVTDSHGQLHHLYSDYLNQGKSVLLEVFYTTCPPCNSIAPLMEPFYQEWGAGDYDVEFFELSDKNFDTDALVNAYQASYDETFIAAGKDGGSLTAVAPYKNGQYGPWYGTPTYIVIAPDGTFQYDVDGPNNAAIISALDEALLATGAQKPVGETPDTISGNVQFVTGTAGVGNAHVRITDSNGNIIVEDITDASGNFDLEFLMSEVQPDWKVEAVKDGALLNGVNTFDLIRIQKHLLFLETIENPFLKLASDANNSVSVTSIDILVILKLLLGRDDHFPDNRTWIVLPADTFGPPAQPAPLLVSDILSGARLPNFIGVKKGDANGTANPNN